ncbi:conserved unknown protein [Ectocarpus siliculosus]|uniref:Chromosome segregation in meiosis protein 3 domain-containing protein n=1 Tax=Ectocarpus siliculosus TaxID=2880 RepID=D7FKE8_ECTSI|nr:conserved unknown protein [Ectocarpus siliculosus]|eukprot:CBJ29350.1 conserved unknown protein [Ectocarpus siliculosus]
MSESEEERRPRPIGVADGSDEDSGMERTDAAGANNGSEPGRDSTGVAAPEEATTAKKVSNRPPAFSENHLVKEKGLWQIYKDFPQKCQYKGRGREAEFLRGLMVAYKEWGYQLYPGVAFEDLACRTEKLGGRARTRSLLRELRDTERDRVLEAKYGREAVDDVHAQEAARLAAKESKTAAAEGDRVEEREDEELAGSRYAMEVDGDGGDEGKSDRQVAAEGSAATMSDQVRQRIEANRRLALDRLRLKKQEAAAAAALVAEKENDGGAAAVPAANDGSREVEDPEEDLMDVDGGGGPGDSFDDDEAALADMEAEEMAARPVAAEASRGKNTVAEPGPAAVVTSPPSTLAVERGARAAGAGCAGSVDEASAKCAVAAARSGEPGTTAGEESGGELPPASEPSAPAPGVGGGRERDGANDEAASLGTTAAASAAGADGITGGAKLDDAVLGGGDGGGGAPEPVAANGDEEGASFSSPAKCRAAAAAAASGLPLSPLGSLFAGTDVSAEGGLAVAREPLGGLFSDENV